MTMDEEQELVEVMAGGIADCIEGVGLPFARTPLRIAMAESALRAAKAAGYTISRSRHGVVHRQEPFT